MDELKPETLALLWARETVAARIERREPDLAASWRAGDHDALPDIQMRIAAYLAGYNAARPAPSPADAGLVERLRAQAQHASEAAWMLAEAKTARQADKNDHPGFDGGYAGVAPEQTLEWQAAARIEALSGEYERGVEDAAQTLEVEASILRTPAGRLQAQWHENDAEMVARELCRRAAAIRTLKAGAPNEENENG